MEITHTAIPEEELEVFASLKNVRVVFDVGTRDDVDYLLIKPKIKLHCFEPNPIFFEQLKNNVGNRKNVYLNNWGAGDIEGEYFYDDVAQMIRYDGNDKCIFSRKVLVKRLDKYIKDNNIKKIDFLKIDVEGYEYKALLGMKDYLKICRYIQLEGNNDDTKRLLDQNGFTYYYIGYSNSIAVRKGEELPYIPEHTKDGRLQLKTEKNYFK